MRPLFLVLFLSAAALPAAAQTAKLPAVPPKLTLAQALRAVSPPDTGLRLTVGADKATLPDGIDAPPAGASLSDITRAFGDITVNFGDVVAVAPSTMVLLNTQPDAPDAAAGISPYVAFKMLAASLDDGQWKALTSEQGIGLANLTDDVQRSLFHALFRRGHLFLGSEDPALDALPPEQRTDVRDVTDRIDGTRVRLGQTADFDLHDKTDRTIFWTLPKPGQAGRLHTWNPKTAPPATVQNVALRADVPNTLKQSDLDWDSKSLQVSVTIAGLKTVGDLVTRIGQQTKMELYADPHYAGKTLTITGLASAAPADDLLRAVCVCVTGTFRKVGPAYVLADDLIGVGVRRKHLAEWKDAADRQISQLRDHAGADLLARRAAEARALPGFGDPLALTPEEIAAVPDDPTEPGIPTILGAPYPFAKLPAAQQDWLRQAAAAYDESRQNGALPDYLTADGPREPDLTRTVALSVDAQVQFLVPSVDTPVDTDLSGGKFLLFFPGADEAYAQAAVIDNREKAKTPAPSLSSVLHLGRCRAVLGHPRTAAEVDALIVAMQKLGLNQLWLDVFSDGVNHVAAGGAHGPDILTEAINRTRGTGIGVYSDISLLAWGGDAPVSVIDLTIDGQNSRQVLLAARAITEGNLFKVLPPLPATLPLEVSPVAGPVQDTLAALVQSLAARPGLAGFVWEDAEAANADLGYTPQMRLAFLRFAHADPRDITQHKDIGANIDAATVLPLFDDNVAEGSLETKWVKFQAGAGLSLIGRLFALSQASRVLPVLAGDDMMVRLTPALLTQASAVADTPVMPKIAARRVAIQSDGDTPALARTLTEDQKSTPSDGFVLDFQQQEVTQGLAPLDSLVRAVAAEKQVK